MRNRSFRNTIPCGCILAVLAACFSTGCAQLDLKDTFNNPFASEDNDPHLPSRVLAVWVDTIRYTQGKAPTRGFGGRLMFYRNGEEEPVKVDGDLVVYAFDEDGRKPTDPRPTRKYVFPAEQLESHYSKSKVGHSYSFFIPWDDVGGLRKEISLIVRFQPELGPPVASEQTRHIPPGKPVPPETQLAEPHNNTRDKGEVRPASFQSEMEQAITQEKTRGTNADNDNRNRTKIRPANTNRETPPPIHSSPN